MRICYLHLTRYPTRLANPVHVMHMCAAMAELGHEVTLVIRAAKDAKPAFENSLFDEYGVSESFDIRVIGHYPFLVRGMLQHRQLKLFLDKLQPELIYSRTTRFARLWTAVGIPYVYETHAMPRHHPRLGLTRRTLLSREFRRLVVITQSLAGDFRSAFPELGPGSITIAPDAANPDRFDAGGDKTGFTAGYVGHLYKGKAMETIEAIAPRLPEIRFDIVGGMSRDIAEWRERTARIKNIRFRGFVPHFDVARLIAGFDLALVPFGRRFEQGKRDTSRWCSPLKIFEYMAQGRAIVAADIPVFREVLEHGRNAWLVPPGDSEAWVDAVQTLRDDPVLRERLGRTALEDFELHYTWAARAGRVLEGLPRLSPVANRSGPHDQ